MTLACRDRCRWFAVVVLAAALTPLACGEFNVLGSTAPAAHREAFESTFDSARAAYDRGDLAAAYDLAGRAYRGYPESEDAAILYGFVNLSMAGADPFGLAIAMVESGKASASGAAAASGGGAGDTLRTLKRVLGLDTAELAQLGSRDDTDPELPLLVPGCVETLRRQVARLQHLDEAITVVCPFVDVEARIRGDARQDCGLHDGPRREVYRSQFLWAFAHLAEAMTFHAVLTYGDADPTGVKSNLELRVAKLQALSPTSPAGLTAYLGAVSAVETTLNAVMPVGGVCSDTAPTTQLTATLNDLLTVDRAFDRIPGLPDKIKASVKNAMARIRNVPVDANAADPRAAQAQALKSDFNKKLATGLVAQIDGLATAQHLDEAQRTTLCASYASISGGSDQRPAICAAP